GASQQVGDLAQYRIAHGVSVAVVDFLEVVQVDEYQRQALAAAPGVADGVLQAVDEQQPVAQPRQWVVVGEVFGGLVAVVQLLDLLENLTLLLMDTACQQAQFVLALQWQCADLPMLREVLDFLDHGPQGGTEGAT